VYANAGHPPGYVIDSSGQIRARLKGKDLPLGIEPDFEFSARGPLSLEAGDTVLPVTDGILESKSPDGDLFGDERVLELVRANRRRTASEIVEALCRAACAFSGGKEPTDDTAAVAIKVESGA
jgi:sigma-B regulation protein RsbU (phosphoserine phosphatase)